MVLHKLHRVAVIESADSDGFMFRFLGIVTQSAIVRFLHLHLKDFGALASIPASRFAEYGIFAHARGVCTRRIPLTSPCCQRL
jgi:hypothetical protein